MYGKSRETKFQLIRVQDRIKYFWKDIRIEIDAVMICRGASWWEWLVVSSLFFWVWPNNYIDKARGGGTACIYGNLPIFRKFQYLNNQSYLTLIKKKCKSPRKMIYLQRSGQKLDPVFHCYKMENGYSDGLLWDRFRVK